MLWSRILWIPIWTYVSAPVLVFCITHRQRTPRISPYPIDIFQQRYRIALSTTNINQITSNNDTLSLPHDYRLQVPSLQHIGIKEGLLDNAFQETKAIDLISFKSVHDVAIWLPVPAKYSGPRLDSDLEQKVDYPFVKSLIAWYKQENHLPVQYVTKILHRVVKLFENESLIMRIPHDPAIRMTIVGDIHGQYDDMIQIFELNGYPSQEHHYVFNGDYVDRGEKSLEVIFTLFALKIALPNSIHINRGNHETINLNSIFGFMSELLAKYPRNGHRLYQDINHVFDMMPVAHVVGNGFFVVHGGLPANPFKLEELNTIKRGNGITHELPIVSDLLWSDPQEQDGVGENVRGPGVISFGPDITRKFLELNGLNYLIRSHEVKDAGYEVIHDGKCITIFSAPYYIGEFTNLGAIINIDSSGTNYLFMQFGPATHYPKRSS